MERTDTLVPNLLKDIGMKYKIPMDQMKTTKSSAMHRLLRVVQRVAGQSYRRVRTLICCSLDALMCRRNSLCPAHNNQERKEKNPRVDSTMAIRSTPSTILIVNISNSTLIDCVIGNDTHSTAALESQPLMKEPMPHIHDHRQSCHSYDQEGAADVSSPSPPVPPPPLPPAQQPHSINIHGSNLKCVIFGDGNYMYTEQTYEDETS